MAKRGNPRWNELKIIKNKDKKIEKEWIDLIKDDEEKEVNKDGKEKQNIFRT